MPVGPWAGDWDRDLDRANIRHADHERKSHSSGRSAVFMMVINAQTDSKALSANGIHAALSSDAIIENEYASHGSKYLRSE
jgi:hypothetical protein